MDAMTPPADEEWMRRALAQARAALEHGDVPIGAVVVHEGRVIGSGHNERERLQDPTAHAEVLALREAAAALGSWRVLDSTLYVTLEPCATDPKAGAAGSVLDVTGDTRLNHRPQMVGGVLAGECGDLLRAFFADRR